jgi:hypothetical protein
VPRHRPGDGLLHPVALAALAVLILNDQVLKAAWPGPVTGKLSDVAGLIVAPLAGQAAWEVGAWLRGRWRGPSGLVLAVAAGVVAAGFVAIQVWPPAVDLYRWGLAILQWPVLAIAAGLSGGSLPALEPVVMTPDVGDLLALPALAVTWWLGRRRLQAGVPGEPATSGGANL